MGGRALTRLELLRRNLYDLPSIAGGRIAAVAYLIAAFFRWAWLRVTGKTAYRFAPMYETKILHDTYVPRGVAAIKQANGLHLPAREMVSDPTVRADVAAAWDAIYGKDGESK